jgi:hypothetical protein
MGGNGFGERRLSARAAFAASQGPAVGRFGKA